YRKRVEQPQGEDPHLSRPRGLPTLSTGLATLAIGFCLFPSRAQAQQRPVEHLDLQTAESLALRHAPAIAREYFRTQAAKEVVKQVRAGLFPQLTGSVAAVGTGDDISSAFGGSPITNVNPGSRPVS